MNEINCPECKGERLKKESLSVTVGGINIIDFTKFSISEALDFINNLKLTEREMMIGERILKEIRERLGFLKSVGLEYLTLSRSSGTLSGGERQRIGLARAFLHDAPFMLLDEPTSNLDSLNEAVILRSLHEERNGKTVVLVSHRESTMRIADKIYSVEHGRMS